MADTLDFTKRLRLLPRCDVLVAGGGIAGSMAAITAARAGAKTVLLENYGFLGGTATVWGGICFCGDTAGQGEVFDGLLEELEELGATVPYQKWDPGAVLRFDHADWDPRSARYFDAAAFQFVLQEMVLREKNLSVLLHTRMVDAVAAGEEVTAVVFHNKDGLQGASPRVAVDCTGDADLAADAGFPCVKGSDSDGAPEVLSLGFSLRDTGREVTPVLPRWGVEYRDEADMPMTSVVLNQNGRAQVKSKVVGHDPVSGHGLTEAEMQSRRNVPGIVYYLQTHGYPTWALNSVAGQIGIRIGRRIVGEYTLTAEDARNGARFDDAVARGTCNLSNLNFMDPTTEKRKYGEYDVEVVPPYQIPFRSLVPRGSRNLLVAGRCLSADRLALSSARMMPTCAMMGQAAGLAAAHAAETQVPVSDMDVAALQKELRAKGAEF